MIRSTNVDHPLFLVIPHAAKKPRHTFCSAQHARLAGYCFFMGIHTTHILISRDGDILIIF